MTSRKKIADLEQELDLSAELQGEQASFFLNNDYE